MLSEAERRTLAGIATRLSTEDPTWVGKFDSTQRRLTAAARPPQERAALIAGASLTAALALVGILAGIPWLIAFFVLSTAWLIWLLDHPLRPPNQRAGREPGEGRP
jgi:hypothetical protein